MNVNENKGVSRFPEEFPSDRKKTYDHGVIESVVKNEISPTSSTCPLKPHNTDAINTEFAKEAMKAESKEN